MRIVQGLLDNEGFEEPIARQLLLEAGALVDSNPRAAWVLAVAAAEVGLKRFVASRASVTEAWLITELQSPPLRRLVKEYLPLFGDTSKWSSESTPIPKRLRQVINDAVEQRNQISHQGTVNPGRDDLVELLHSVNDFLYLLDWFSGEEWAWTHVREETRRAWS
jgi:hypothetical protein